MDRKVKKPAKPPDSFSLKEARKAVRAVINYPVYIPSDYSNWQNCVKAVRDREKRIKMLWEQWRDLAEIADIQSKLIDAKETTIKLLEENKTLLENKINLLEGIKESYSFTLGLAIQAIYDTCDGKMTLEKLREFRIQMESGAEISKVKM